MTTSASTPFLGGGEGDRLRVVAGADRDHAAALLLGGEAAQLVERAARLEGAGALEELALEPRAERAADESIGVRARRSPIVARARDVVSGGGVAVSHAGAPPRRGGPRRRSRCSGCRRCAPRDRDRDVRRRRPRASARRGRRPRRRRQGGRVRAGRRRCRAVAASTTAATSWTPSAATSSSVASTIGQREDGAGRGADRVRVPGVGLGVRDEQRVGAGGVRGARHRAEVAGLLDADGDEDERGVARQLALRRFDNGEHAFGLGAVRHLREHARAHLAARCSAASRSSSGAKYVSTIAQPGRARAVPTSRGPSAMNSPSAPPLPSPAAATPHDLLHALGSPADVITRDRPPRSACPAGSRRTGTCHERALDDREVAGHPGRRRFAAYR